MALPLGKLTIIVGAGILGSVLAREGRTSNVTDFITGAAKVAWKQLKRDDSTPSVSRPRNDSLLAQVNSLQEELRMLASNRPVTIVTSTGAGSNKYGVVIVVLVVGYGYVWWKGWRLPDMMFATRRSLSDACVSIGQQLENVYSSVRSTRRQLSASIDHVDSNLNAVAELTASTHERVTELRDDSAKLGQDVRYVRDVVETLELKICRYEGKQDVTSLGVRKLLEHANNMENNQLEENTQASTSSSRIAYPSKVSALPPPLSEPSSPLAANGSNLVSNGSALVSNGSREVQRPPLNAAPAPGQQRTNGISGVVEVTSSPGISEDIHSTEETNNGSSWFRNTILTRTFSGTNNVLRRTSSSRQHS